MHWVIYVLVSPSRGISTISHRKVVSYDSRFHCEAPAGNAHREHGAKSRENSLFIHAEFVSRCRIYDYLTCFMHASIVNYVFIAFKTESRGSNVVGA